MGTKKRTSGSSGGGSESDNGGMSSGTGSGQQRLGDDGTRSPAEQEVEDSCEERADESEVPQKTGQSVAERRDRIRETLEEKLDIREEHVFGSLTRGTIVGPMGPDSDTDVMYVLDSNTHGEWDGDKEGARKALQQVKRVIENDAKYSQTEVSIDRNVVAVKFHDFTVEITPAFERGDDYVIPDTYQKGHSWVRTNPRKYKRIFEAADEARGGQLQKVARLAKEYNQNTGNNVYSYHMELLAYSYMQTRSKTDEPLDEHLDEFFEQLPRRLSSGTYDPATRNRVDGEMDRGDRQEAISSAKRAREKIRRAKRLKNAGNHQKAKELYQEVIDGDLS